MSPTFRAVLPLALCFLAACAMPQTTARTVDHRPSLAVTGAPAGSVLLIDGQEVGPANAYDGNPAVLRLEPGTHQVEVRRADGAPLLAQKVFLDSELKRIEVH
jgi:hypothetical protein